MPSTRDIQCELCKYIAGELDKVLDEDSTKVSESYDLYKKMNKVLDFLMFCRLKKKLITLQLKFFLTHLTCLHKL